MSFEISRIFPPPKMTIPEHTNPRSRETTGGLIRFEEAVVPPSRGWVGRGIAR